MEKYTKTLRNQNLNDFFLYTGLNYIPTTKNFLSFQKYAVSEKVIV